jgi:multidrug efflux pump
MDDYALRMEELFKTIPEVERYFVVIGFPTVSQMITFVRVKPWDERERTVQEMARELQPKFAKVPGILAFASTPPPLGQSPRSKPVNFVLMSSGPYQELEKLLEGMLAEIAKNPSITNVDTDLKLNTPQLRVTVNRDKAADMGIPVQTVGATLETLFGGRQVTRFKIAGKQYDVMVQVAGVDRNNPQDLSKIYVRAASGEMVRLSNLVNVEETVAPKELNHFNQMRAATITANLAPGYTLGEALAYIEEAADRVLPIAVRTDYSGESREFREASSSLYFTFLLALLFIYLVLAAQFESFVDPFIIMMTVPLSMTGALLALWLSGHTLNIYSQVGLVTLIGLITKHGILIVEFSNQLRAQGRAMNEAVTEACVLRLRPILMTTGAMVLGAVPLALAHGAGAVSRQAIGWVIVGGLLVGTFFTLFVIPVVYTYLARGKKFAYLAPAAPVHAAAPAEKLQAAE